MLRPLKAKLTLVQLEGSRIRLEFSSLKLVMTGTLTSLAESYVTNTMLGPLNVQWDFSDYRDVSGIKLPFLIRTSEVSAYDTVVRKFSEIKIDSSLGENVFDIPRVPSGP